MPPRRRRQTRRVEIDTRDPIEELTAQILRLPQVQGILDAVDNLGRRLETLPDELIAAAKRPPERPKPPPRKKREAPPPPPRPEPTLDARAVLHFGPDEPLDRRKIKQRQRELARMVHPDRSGSKEAMQKINIAANALLANFS